MYAQYIHTATEHAATEHAATEHAATEHHRKKEALYRHPTAHSEAQSIQRFSIYHSLYDKTFKQFSFKYIFFSIV